MNANLYALLQSRFPQDRAQPALETVAGDPVCIEFVFLQ